jgi:transcriptional accessory protein Tex/SPT6
LLRKDEADQPTHRRRTGRPRAAGRCRHPAARWRSDRALCRRYRKEATGALDDAQLRTLDERLRYLRELDERRAAILDSISPQGKLDAALNQAIEAADSKARLEDLYLPYRPKRRTKAAPAQPCEGDGPAALTRLAA